MPHSSGPVDTAESAPGSAGSASASSSPSPAPPLAPRRPRFFYGWCIVLGAVVGQFAAMGVAGQISGVFLRPVTDDLGWAAADYTLGTSAAFVAGGISGFFIGPLVDRFGARPLMLIGGVMYGLALAAISRVDEVWQFIALQTLAGGLGFAMVGPLVVNVTLSKWFVVRRGWAITIGSMGVSLAALIMPVAMTQVVDAEGWRIGYLVMGVLVWVLVIPVALLMRRTPEDYGLLPDGKRDDDEVTPLELAQREASRRDFANSFTRREALRTPALWMLVIGFGLNMGAVSALLVHAIPFATDGGFTRAEAASGFAAVGLANFASKFVWGFGLQRFQVRRVAASAFLASATGVLLLIVAVNVEVLPLLLGGFLVWGFGFGGTIPIGEFVWARYFGRRYLGAVRSVGQPITILLGSLGPISMALYYDASGSYGPAFAGLAASYLLGGTLIFLSREPEKPEEPLPEPPRVTPEVEPGVALPVSVAGALRRQSRSNPDPGRVDARAGFVTLPARMQRGEANAYRMKGDEMADQFPIEAGHILLFARSVGDANPIYHDEGYAKGTEPGQIVAPPTFVQASAQFTEDYGLRPKIDQWWFGSGKEPRGSGAPKPPEQESGGGSGGGGLHAEQHYEYHRPLTPGMVLHWEREPGESWEREGRRAGKLIFSESITKYYDQDNNLVITARSVGVRTERPATQG